MNAPMNHEWTPFFGRKAVAFWGLACAALWAWGRFHGSAQNSSEVIGIVRPTEGPMEVVSAEVSPWVVFSSLKQEDIIQKLGLEEGPFGALVGAFGKAFHEGNSSPDFCKEQPLVESVQSLCEAASTLEAPADRKRSARSMRLRRISFSRANFASLQKATFRHALTSLKAVDPEKVLKEVDKIVDYKACPRSLSAAALRHVEDLLPSADVMAAEEKFYQHASECLTPEDDVYESTHFRQALLRELNHDRTGAREAMRKAVLTQNSTDPARLYYWAGWFEEAGPERSQYWNKILQDRPLSFQALLVWEQLGVDPYRIFSERAAVNPMSPPSDAKLEMNIHWAEAFALTEHGEENEWWIKRIYEQSHAQLSSSNILYLSLLLSKNSSYLEVIAFLNKAAHDHPEILNTQILSLLYPRPFFEVFDRASPGIDTFLVMGLARQESGFDPNARSRSNARGLMQILPATAELIEHRSSRRLFDVETNASVGSRYFKQLIERFGSVELALAAYNAGPEKVEAWQKRYPTSELLVFLDLIPYRETRNYVPSILRNNYWYRRLYSAPTADAREPAAIQEESELVRKIIGSHVKTR